jgi:predicted lipoprotein with Yx(FWY)xxD motif
MLDEQVIKRAAVHDDSPIRKASLGGCMNCGVETKWHAFAASDLATPAGRWGILTRTDGDRVWTYQGRSLFTFVGDHDASDINGVGLPGARPVVLLPNPPAPPPGITVQHSLIGPVYADLHGMSLYVFSCDRSGYGTPGVSCDWWSDDVVQREMFCPAADRCAEMWTPAQAPRNAVPRAGDWSVATISDPVRFPLRWAPVGAAHPTGSAQEIKVWTYMGRPVYTSTEDRVPAELRGHRIGNFLGPGQWTALFAGEREGPN